jgi:hypothetical protein
VLRTPARRLLPLGILVLLCGCGVLPGGKLSAAGAAKVLASTNGTARGPVRCGNGSIGWDYVCTYADGTKQGVDVNSRRATAVSPPASPGVELQPAPDTELRRAWSTYYAQATAICNRANALLAALPHPRAAAGKLAVLDRSIAINERMLGRLDTLIPPMERAHELGRMRARLRAVLFARRGLRRALGRGDRKAARRALERGALSVESARRLAHRLGLDRCAAGGPA